MRKDERSSQAVATFDSDGCVILTEHVHGTTCSYKPEPGDASPNLDLDAT